MANVYVTSVQLVCDWSPAVATSIVYSNAVAPDVALGCVSATSMTEELSSKYTPRNTAKSAVSNFTANDIFCPAVGLISNMAMVSTLVPAPLSRYRKWLPEYGVIGEPTPRAGTVVTIDTRLDGVVLHPVRASAVSKSSNTHR